MKQKYEKFIKSQPNYAKSQILLCKKCPSQGFHRNKMMIEHTFHLLFPPLFTNRANIINIISHDGRLTIIYGRSQSRTSEKMEGALFEITCYSIFTWWDPRNTLCVYVTIHWLNHLSFHIFIYPYTDRNNFEDSYKLVKHFPDLTFWKYWIAFFK